MGCCLGCLACNAASCVCSGACSLCGKMVSMSSVGGRIAYAVVFFLTSLLAWVFRSWAVKVLDWVPVLQDFCPKMGGLCYGTLAVYRLSFCLAVFHLVMAMITIGVKTRGDCRIQIQDGWWAVKLLLLIGACIGSFFIPNPFFEYYGWVAFACSVLFILIQLILLVDFAHSWAENWIEKYEASEEGDSTWWYILLASTFGLLGFSIALSIVMYIFFIPDGSVCGANVAFITINVILVFFFCILSIHPKVQEANEKSGLLQPALIAAYTTYLVFSALMSETDQCNPWSLSTTTAASNVSLIIGAVFTILAVLYATMRAASQVGDIEEKQPLSSTVNDEEAAEEEVAAKVDPNEPVTYNFARFHLVFALGAMYLSMLMTDWSTVYNAGTDNATVDTGMAATWVKVVSSWLCSGLFLWTLVAPLLFPDREWGK